MILPHSCSRCPSRWSGLKAAHCPSCCRTFSSPASFDAHRIRREGTCADPAGVGLVPIDRFGYLTWGFPPSRAAAAYFARQTAEREAGHA
jgi:hypothetical protein